MSLYSKQCPKCDGTGKEVYGFKGKPIIFTCCGCRGTGSVYTFDPPTAGREPSAGYSSGRRSLPALDKVREHVEMMVKEARRRRRILWDQGHDALGTQQTAFLSALYDVLKFIAEVECEAPEGNTEVSDSRREKL